MQKQILLGFAACVLGSSAHAQFIPDTTTYRSIWKFDLAGAFDSDEYTLSYERVVTDNVSVVMSAGYLGGYHRQDDDRGDGLVLRQENIRTGFSLRPEFRYYLTEFTGSRRPVAAFMSLFPFYSRSVTTIAGDEAFVTGSFTDPAPMPIGNPLWVEWYDLTETVQLYGLGGAIGGQVFVKGGVGLEFEVSANLFFNDFLREGTEYREGVPNDARRRQVSREVGLSGRIYITYGH